MIDAVVVGAGVAGLYQLHQLRDLGLSVRGYDAADDVGGTWWWHGYPGARLDTEGHVYQYLFSSELYHDWGWSERYPAGYEVLRWLRFVADRLDLRRDLSLSTRVVDARWHEAERRWTVRTDRGDTVEARFLVACTGVLDGPADEPDGLDDFAGPVLRTASWPAKGPDLAGLRVGVLGAGSTGAAGVQLLPTLARQAAQVTLFAGAPCHLVPRVNPMFGWQERERYKARFDQLRATIPHTWTGADDPVVEASPAQRRATIEALHRDGSRALWSATARGLLPAAEVAVSVRRAMRERLADPRLADIVVPTGDLGAARVPLESGYLEALGRDDVEVVDALAAPVVRVHPEGVELADGAGHALDAIVVATDFDAGPPALARVEVHGRGGRRLALERTSRPGPAVPGFPNLFTVSAPPSPLHTTTTSLQQQTEWITRAVADLRARGETVIEAVREGPGHRTGGVGDARRRGDAEAAAGYPSFVRT